MTDWLDRLGVHDLSQDDLAGVLDFAVFTAADFNANFGGLGYVPGNALVYTYQVDNTGIEAISAEIVGISNPADTPGSFNIGDVQPSTADLTPNAVWQFLANENGVLNTNESSWGLAFSSPNVPMNGLALTLDGGTSALSFGVPTPSATPIPEPTSLILLALGGVTMCCWMRRRR